MKGLKVLILFLSFLALSFFTFAQTAPAPAAPTPAATTAPTVPLIPTPTVGIPKTWEVCLGFGQMFFTETANQQYTIDASNILVNVDGRYWLNNHFALGFSVYHDTIDLAKLTSNLPVGSHSIWGYDVIGVYTLKTYDTGISPQLPSQVQDYLNSHAKRITVDTIGGVGLINIDGTKTATYFLGAQTNYWIDEQFSIKLITDLRHATYLGVAKTFPEVRLLAAYRF